MVAWCSAILLHLVAGGILLLARGEFPRPDGGQQLTIHLPIGTEQARPPEFLVASLPRSAAETPAAGTGDLKKKERQSATPVPTPSVQTPAPVRETPRAIAREDEQLQQLAAEREQLKLQLEHEKQLAAAPLSVSNLPAPPEPQPNQLDADGGLGTVRSLDFEGWPKKVVDEIMRRYDLHITHRKLMRGSNQNFLSSAANERGDKFYADRGTNPGVYEVFELSRRAIAKMSELEEQEIRKRGMNLQRTRVKEARFGIVETGAGEYDIGIVKFVASEVP
jgi:hypothetical protein